MQEITSPNNPFIKHLVKLRESRAYREQQRRLVISGSKMIRELSSSCPFLSLLVEEGCDFTAKAEKIFSVTPSVLKKVTGLENPEPVAAEIEMPPYAEVASVPLLLILDGIADPGNLGTLLRTALGLGWAAVFITEGSVDPYNEKALRAAKGATFRLPWRMGPIEEILEKRKGQYLVADRKGAQVSEKTLSLPIALILGNEAHGPNPLFKKNSELVCVKMQGQMESLNVAIAGAILMDQIRSALR